MTTIELKKRERNIEVELKNKINNDMTEKRYFVAELVKKALDRYLDFDDMSADNSLSVYTLPIINKELSIIDFEINSLSVHVVATFDKAKNQNVYIPQIYKQLHYKPDMILFVNFSKTFTKMEMLGYITDINFQRMSISKDELLSAENLIETLQEIKPKGKKASNNIINTTNELMLAYIDNDLSDEGKRFFIKNILENKEVRKNYKLFYTMNCDFISIAKTREIEKTNPYEEENKIELQSRSDYLIDKAISKYEQEHNNQNTLEEESINLLSNTEEPAIINVDNDENILELSLQDLSQEQDLNLEETPVELQLEQETQEEEQIELNNEQQESDNEQQEFDNEEEQESTLEQTEPIDELSEISEEPIEQKEELSATDENTIELAEETEENENDNFELIDQEDNEFELSLDNDDELMDLSQMDFNESETSLEDNNELESFDDTNILQTEPENITENHDEEIQEEHQEYEIKLLDNSDDIEIDNATNESNDNELEENLNNDNEFSNILQPTENQQQEELSSSENLEDITEDEDLFAFLSDISNEEELKTTQQEETLQNNILPENETLSDQIQPEINDFSEAAIQTDVPEQINEQESDNNVEINMNINIPQQQKKKSNSKTLLLGLMLAVVLGGGLAITNKDVIISKLTKGNTAGDIPGLTLDEDNELPPPIDNIEDKTSDNIKQPTDTATAPAPAPTQTPSKNNNSTDNVPPAQNAPTLPNLPSTTVEPPKAKHLNDAIANALTKDYNGVRISKVSWEASETLVNNPDVKRYLTITGKSVKNTLSQDLIAATEPSFKDTIVVLITYRKDGSVARIDITGSSGSAQIDDIVKKSVDNTLKFVKMPALNLSTPEYTAKLIIRL